MEFARQNYDLCDNTRSGRETREFLRSLIRLFSRYVERDQTKLSPPAHEAFERSLARSEKLITPYLNPDAAPLGAALDELSNQSTRTFVLHPLEITTHVLCPVIYRTRNGFRVIFPNRGSTGQRAIRFINGKENQSKETSFNVFQFSDSQRASLIRLFSNGYKDCEKAYDAFRTLATSEALLALSVPDQYIGNCPVKGPEVALKLAYYLAKNGMHSLFVQVSRSSANDAPVFDLKKSKAEFRKLALRFGNLSFRQFVDQWIDSILKNPVAVRGLIDLVETNKDIRKLIRSNREATVVLDHLKTLDRHTIDAFTLRSVHRWAGKNRGELPIDGPEGEFLATIQNLFSTIQTIPENVNEKKWNDAVNEGLDYFPSAKADLVGECASLIGKKADALYQAKSYRLALPFYSRVTRLQPHRAGAFFDRALCLDKLGRDFQAIRDYSSALRLDREMADAYWNRALTYLSKHFTKKALRDFTRYICLEPSNPAGYRRRGQIYESRGLSKLANSDFKAAKRLAAMLPSDA